MRTFDGRVAAITGAASGIGRALALSLAGQGAQLALSDVNTAGLEETRQLVADRTRVETEHVDVADRDAVHAWAAKTEDQFGAAHLVVNNAGVGLGGKLRNLSYEDFEWLMNINFWGVVHGTLAFLPLLERQDEAHIVNISSVFGIIAAPLNGAYNAAKFAVRGFTEALRMEVELDGLPIGVTCVHPGGIRTNIVNASRMQGELSHAHGEIADEFQRHARTTPERCAEIILEGVRRNAPRVLVGPDARLIDVVQRVAPTGYQRLAQRIAQRHWPTMK